MNAEQKNRFRQIGKQAFIREEMTRLGFWPPSPEVAAQAAVTEKQLRAIYDELAAVQTDLSAVEAKIAEAGDIPKLLQEVRRKRIERVRAERAARREARVAELAQKRAEDATWRQKTLPFLGDGVSQSLVYDAGAPEKLAALGLPPLTSATDVAQAMGLEERELAWLTYHRGAATVDHYSRFLIPKRRGGTRVISSPKRRLRVAQRWLLEHILAPLPVHDAAVAFRPGLSVVDNAMRHTGRAVVVRIDLKDFFPSVTLPRVRRLFQSLGYNGGMATLFALLATESPRVAATLDGQTSFVALGERCLPQGACTSPALTNLLCRRMDARLAGAAEALGFRYSRYADDLVFSHAEVSAPVSILLTLARRIIVEIGFTINEEKTSVLRRQHRQVVTGVVVNETPHVSREDLRRFRAILHRCETQGIAVVSQQMGRDVRAYAAGYLAFLHMVCPQQAERVRAKHPWVTQWQKPDPSVKSGGATGYNPGSIAADIPSQSANNPFN